MTKHINPYVQRKKLTATLSLSVVFFMAALVFFLFGGNNKDRDTMDIATTTPVTISVLPVVRLESFTYATSSINLDVEYPQLVRLASSSVEKIINTNLKKEAKKLYDQTLKELKSSISALPSGREVVFERKLEKDRSYINMTNGMGSFVYTQYSDTGGAHGSFSYASIILDMFNGNTLKLSDMLKGDYEKILLSEIEKSIRNTDTESTSTCARCEDLSGELDNLKVSIPENFVLTESGIIFLYSAYDLGSYAATSNGQEVFISKDVLKDNISQEW